MTKKDKRIAKYAAEIERLGDALAQAREEIRAHVCLDLEGASATLAIELEGVRVLVDIHRERLALASRQNLELIAENRRLRGAEE